MLGRTSPGAFICPNMAVSSAMLPCLVDLSLVEREYLFYLDNTSYFLSKQVHFLCPTNIFGAVSEASSVVQCM